MRIAHYVVIAVSFTTIASCKDDDERPAATRFTYSVEPEAFKPFEATIEAGDGYASPIVAVMDDEGIQNELIGDEIIVVGASEAELASLLERTGGTIVGSDAIPPPPESTGIVVDPAELAAKSYTIRVTTFPELTELDRPSVRGLDGHLKLQSELAGRIVALTMREQAAGLNVSLNFLSAPTGVLYSTQDEDVAAAGAPPSYFDAVQAQELFLKSGHRPSAARAWGYLEAQGYAYRSVRVAVIDGGFDITHDGLFGTPAIDGLAPELPLVMEMYDFQGGHTNVQGNNPNHCTGGSDCPTHGAHSALVIAGELNNHRGSGGTGGQVVAPVLYRVRMDDSQLRVAFGSARYWKVPIVNGSFGGECGKICRIDRDYSGYVDQLDSMLNAGVIFVVSAGNDDIDVNDKHYWPCVYDKRVICVGALNNDAVTKKQYSNYGSGVDIWATTDIRVAPAQYLAGDDTTKDFANAGGTSAAAPYVSGIVAMMKAVRPSLTQVEAKEILQSTGWQTTFPVGDEYVREYVNAYAAVVKAAGDTIRSNGYEPDDSAASATPFDNTVAYDLTIGPDSDFYRFTMTDDGRLELAIENHAKLMGAMTMTLRGANGLVVTPSFGAKQPYDRGLKWGFTIPEGVYTIEVKSPFGLQEYGFAAQNKPNTIELDPYEVNDVAAQAYFIGSGDSFHDMTLHAASTPDEDWYTFVTPSYATATEQTKLEIFGTPRPVCAQIFTTAGDTTALSETCLKFNRFDLTKLTQATSYNLRVRRGVAGDVYKTHYHYDVWTEDKTSHTGIPGLGGTPPKLWKNPTLEEIHMLTGLDDWLIFSGVRIAEVVRLRGDGLAFEVYDLATNARVAESTTVSTMRDPVGVQEAGVAWMSSSATYVLHIVRQPDTFDASLPLEDLPAVEYAIAIPQVR